ncbi:hypothetical protein BV22DRAFT_1051508 [Leucogyrophana mollusca]|uniref:Uncharacterized protein n=1 Tax=Leucogyrophana mollusca TaxID=85980 RepID=A0ACB8B0M8_9AGAM|nr:hypothetical protein BV22DRAFT_1051508 [Leucogyrophana mollusca]
MATQQELTVTKTALQHARERNVVLSKRNHALVMQVARAPKQKAHAVQRASEKTIEKVKATGPGTFVMKEKGIITETARGMLRDLVALHNVPAAHAEGVVSVVTAAVGVTVEGRANRQQNFELVSIFGARYSTSSWLGLETVLEVLKPPPFPQLQRSCSMSTCQVRNSGGPELAPEIVMSISEETENEGFKRKGLRAEVVSGDWSTRRNRG